MLSRADSLSESTALSQKDVQTQEQEKKGEEDINAVTEDSGTLDLVFSSGQNMRTNLVINMSYHRYLIDL